MDPWIVIKRIVGYAASSVENNGEKPNPTINRDKLTHAWDFIQDARF